MGRSDLGRYNLGALKPDTARALSVAEELNQLVADR